MKYQSDNSCAYLQIVLRLHHILPQSNAQEQAGGKPPPCHAGHSVRTVQETPSKTTLLARLLQSWESFVTIKVRHLTYQPRAFA